MAADDNSNSNPPPPVGGYRPSLENKGGNLSGHVQLQKMDTKYELIDIDPHFRRVLRYYRTSDYWTWAGFTVGVPLVFGGMMLFWKVPRMLGTPLIGAKYWRLTTGIGFVTGFLVSYQDSCKRFWGWTENEREVKMDMEEMLAKIRAGQPLYGVSQMDPHHQEISASQSRFAQLKFHIFPFFNFANHNHHGVSIEKYIAALPEEEKKEWLEKAKKQFRAHKLPGLEKAAEPEPESEAKTENEEGG